MAGFGFVGALEKLGVERRVHTAGNNKSTLDPFLPEKPGDVERIKDDVDVRGYRHWSALDNYEWGEWGPTFGLIAVDRETFARTPRPSLGWYGDAARAHRQSTAVR